MLPGAREWEGSRALRLSHAVNGLYLSSHALEAGFENEGEQVRPSPVRVTGNLMAPDGLLSRAGWRRESAPGPHYLHHLLADERDPDIFSAGRSSVQ